MKYFHSTQHWHIILWEHSKLCKFHTSKHTVTQCSILAKKVTCTCPCNFKKIHAHNLVYMHMMSMVKYMHKIYVVLQVVVIPRDIPTSISSLRRAPLMSQVMPHHLHCEIDTQHFHHAEAEQIHLYFYLHLFLLLSPSPCHCSIPPWNFTFYHCVVRIDYHCETSDWKLTCTCACRVENLTCTKKKVHAFVQVCMPKIEHCSYCKTASKHLLTKILILALLYNSIFARTILNHLKNTRILHIISHWVRVYL